ncbi:MAG: DUF364 domain-containing protein [Methylotetracoccus sp.]
MRPGEFYDLLLDYASAPDRVREVMVGLVWTYCRTRSVGLSMSPGMPSRTLAWAGTLRGRPVSELAGWVRDFDPHRAAVGMAAVNAAISALGPLPDGVRLPAIEGHANNLAVFQHFRPLIKGRKVAVVGRYPGLDEFAAAAEVDLTVFELQPGPGDLPSGACEYLLPEFDWVFLTASTIPNKTFPRLAELARSATTVLMGPTTPWLPELHHFGIDYLAGVEVVNPRRMREIVAEGGGVRLFDEGVAYRVVPLTKAAATQWTRALIASTVQQKDLLLMRMEEWYRDTSSARFPDWLRLEGVNRRLSRLDSCYKALWDGDAGSGTTPLRTSG